MDVCGLGNGSTAYIYYAVCVRDPKVQNYLISWLFYLGEGNSSGVVNSFKEPNIFHLSSHPVPTRPKKRMYTKICWFLNPRSFHSLEAIHSTNLPSPPKINEAVAKKQLTCRANR